jgi:hypothetical protein
MFPVLAEQEISVINQRHRQRLADGERVWQIRALATKSEASTSSERSPVRAWQRLLGVAQSLVRSGGARPVELGSQGATARS